LATTNGGTGLTSFTSGGVVYASSTSALATGSALTFDGTNFAVSGVGVFGAGTTKLRTYSDSTYSGIFNGASLTAAESIYMGAGTQFFYVAGAEGMRLTSSGLEVKQSQLIGYSSYAGIGTNGLAVAGNVGIGTSSPTYKLDVLVAGNNGIRTTSSAGQQLYLGNTGGDAVVGTLNNYSLGLLTNGSVRATLDSSGNLGIGTSSPGYKLDVSATGSTPVRFTRTDGVYVLSLVGTGTSSNGALGMSTNDMVFLTNGSERARITSGGNLLVGTTADNGARLVVGGTSSGAVAGTRNVLQLRNANATGNQSSFLVFGSAGEEASCFIGNDNAANGTERQVLSFGTAGIERARITSAGSFVAGAQAALATTATDGFLYVPTCAGTPTGTPTSITGMAPIVVNTTNNKLYFYSGGAWRDAGP
jgi:hypothetical protein